MSKMQNALTLVIIHISKLQLT